MNISIECESVEDEEKMIFEFNGENNDNDNFVEIIIKKEGGDVFVTSALVPLDDLRSAVNAFEELRMKRLKREKIMDS